MASKYETPAPGEGEIAELYSIRDVARIVGVSESRLRYWIQSGLLTPSVRRGGRFFYTFRDLVNAKAAVELVEAGIPPARIRAQMTALRAELPEGDAELTKLRICSDGARVVVVGDDATYEPTTGQLVMAFAVKSLGDHVARVLELPQPSREAPPFPETGYQLFLRGLAAEERGDDEAAAQAYRDAVAAEPGLASAHANLGVLGYRRGDHDAARAAFERALELDPELPEARFNLANLLADVGETDLAIAELRRVCSRHPDYPDAHYNLAVLLASVGGFGQARGHLSQFLAVAPEDPYATRAHVFLERLGGSP
jgi:DNA-binding transcriptional MerR regulator